MPDQHPASELHSFSELNQLTLMGCLVVSDMEASGLLMFSVQRRKGHTIYTGVDQASMDYIPGSGLWKTH